MKFRLNTRISFGLNVSTSVALIIMGAFLVKYNIDPSGSLFFLIGVVVAIFGLISLLDLIAGRRKKDAITDSILSVLLIIGGILIAIWSEPLQAYGLLVVGFLLIALAINDIMVAARTRSALSLTIGILRILVAIALIVSGTSVAFDKNGQFVATLWQIIGSITIGFGVVFLMLETFLDKK